MHSEARRKWVLIVGISEYKDADRSMGPARYLPGVSYDAWLLRQVLEHSSDVPARDMHIARLPTADRRATKAEIEAEIDFIAQRAISSDQLVFYFGGHGHCVPGGESPLEDGMTRYLLPYEATFNTAEEYGLSVRFLADALGGVRAEQAVVILDCCYGAGIGRMWAARPAFRAGSHCVIASAERQSLELNDGGFLVRPFCEALEGIGIQTMSDGRVSLATAFDYAAPRADAEAAEVQDANGLLVYQEAEMFSFGGPITLTRPKRELPLPSEAPLKEIEMRRPPDQAFLIALVNNVRSEPIERGKRLILDIRDDQKSIYSNAGKGEFFDRVRRIDREPVLQWEKDIESGRESAYFREDLPLRWASGGALPVVHHRGESFLVLFFREIYPEGWNTANGASDTWDEMYQLRRLVEREFREEVLIHDPNHGVVYWFADPERDYHDLMHQKRALELWGLGRCARKPLPCRFHRGPDSVCVRMLREGSVEIASEISGFYISVNAGELGIECTQVVDIVLPDELALEELAFLDGEISYPGDRLQQRPVGLLEVEACRDWLTSGEGSDAPFRHVYESGIRLRDGLRGSQRITASWSHRNTLCEVTAKTIRRHFLNHPGTAGGSAT